MNTILIEKECPIFFKYGNVPDQKIILKDFRSLSILKMLSHAVEQEMSKFQTFTSPILQLLKIVNSHGNVLVHDGKVSFYEDNIDREITLVDFERLPNTFLLCVLHLKPDFTVFKQHLEIQKTELQTYLNILKLTLTFNNYMIYIKL